MRQKNILTFSFLLVIAACGDQGGHNIEATPSKSRESTYRYGTSFGTMVQISGLDFIGTGSWVLKEYSIMPSSKTNINLGSNDTLYFHKVAEENQSDITFSIESKSIYEGDQVIGDIRVTRYDTIDSQLSREQKRIERFWILFNFKQPNDSIVNGPFSLAWLNKGRLHLTQKRVLKDKEESDEKIRLIFYQKEKLSTTKSKVQ